MDYPLDLSVLSATNHSDKIHALKITHVAQLTKG